MSQISYQTTKLQRGRHASPEEGVCVMELASMLAGESFTDYPESVCPVIGSVLRTYNDWTDDRSRQDLYAYAARIVGTAGNRDVQRARVAHLNTWTQAYRRRHGARSLLPTRVRNWAPKPIEHTGKLAVYAISKYAEDPHAEALALIDELLALGGHHTAWTPEVESARTAAAPV